MGYRYPPAAHEIRVVTGATAPSLPIEVVLNVRDEYLSGLPSDRTPDLYSRVIAGLPDETHSKYLRLPSTFDDQGKTVRAEVPLVSYEEYRPGKGIEAVIMIGSRLKV